MTSDQQLPTSVKFASWYLILLFGSLLTWEVLGRLWNLLLFEKTRTMMGADAPIGTLVLYILCFASAIAFLRLKKAGFFAILLVNLFLIAGCTLALSDMTAKAEWGHSWPYAAWACIFLVLSSVSVIFVLSRATRKMFFDSGRD